MVQGAFIDTGANMADITAAMVKELREKLTHP